jgi:hypothetical protein
MDCSHFGFEEFSVAEDDIGVAYTFIFVGAVNVNFNTGVIHGVIVEGGSE